MRNWSFFVVCLLLSAGIWLIYNLSQTQSSIVSMEIVAESNIEGRAKRSSDAITMTARVRASGFRLLSIMMRKKAVVVAFSSEDLHHLEADYYSISANQLLRYASEIYGSGTNVEAFLFDRVSFRFISENNKRVPVRAVNALAFRAQYAQLSDLSLKPDSVTVYGPAEVLERVDEVYTSVISLSDIHSNVHGETKLETPRGTRLSEQEVEYSFEVSRYVELKTELPIVSRNVPKGLALSVYPSKAVLTFKAVFPLITDPVGLVSAYVDYKEFACSITGRCMVRTDELPKGVISCSIKPEVVDCVEQDTSQR